MKKYINSLGGVLQDISVGGTKVELQDKRYSSIYKMKCFKKDLLSVSERKTIGEDKLLEVREIKEIKVKTDLKGWATAAMQCFLAVRIYSTGVLQIIDV